MPLEALFAPLIQLGGLGILAAVLLYLHVGALKTHREDLAAERTLWLKLRDGDREDAERRHREVLGHVRLMPCQWPGVAHQPPGP